MSPLIGREYCLKHPRHVVRTFGFGVLVSTLLGPRKNLLEESVRHHELHGYALPGTVGRAYRLAAIIECRVARLYGRLAERFGHIGPVRDFYLDLQREEEDHSLLMELCRYTISLKPGVTFAPGPRDPTVRAIRDAIGDFEARLETFSLDEALRKTEELERSEVNVIFERLLRQVDAPQSRIFEERLREAEGHDTAVPQQIRRLRRQLSLARAA